MTTAVTGNGPLGVVEAVDSALTWRTGGGAARARVPRMRRRCGRDLRPGFRCRRRRVRCAGPGRWTGAPGLGVRGRPCPGVFDGSGGRIPQGRQGLGRPFRQVVRAGPAEGGQVLGRAGGGAEYDGAPLQMGFTPPRGVAKASSSILGNCRARLSWWAPSTPVRTCCRRPYRGSSLSPGALVQWRAARGIGALPLRPEERHERCGRRFGDAGCRAPMVSARP